MISKRNIALIGMPGCGKTSIGKELAQKLHMKFYDIDEYIEIKENKTIPEIFKSGEKYFREIEKNAVREVSEKENIIISTGGGVVKNEVNINMLKQNGIVIFIDRPVENIVSDVDVSNRPLLKDGPEKIFNLYQERIELYRKYCDYEILNDGEIEETINNILKLTDDN